MLDLLRHTPPEWKEVITAHFRIRCGANVGPGAGIGCFFTGEGAMGHGGEGGILQAAASIRMDLDSSNLVLPLSRPSTPPHPPTLCTLPAPPPQGVPSSCGLFDNWSKLIQNHPIVKPRCCPPSRNLPY